MDTPAIRPAGHPHTWRVRFMDGYRYIGARGGMRDMPELLYAVAMHIAHSDLSDDLEVEYSPRSFVQFGGTLKSVRLVVRVLVALGYLEVIREPRAPLAGIYRLTVPIAHGPRIDEAWDLLEAEGWSNNRSRNTDKAVKARKEKRNAEIGASETVAPVDNSGHDESPMERHDVLSMERHDVLSMERHDVLSLPIGGSGTTGTTHLPEVTTDVVHIPSARERQEMGGDGAALIALDGGRAQDFTHAIREAQRRRRMAKGAEVIAQAERVVDDVSAFAEAYPEQGRALAEFRRRRAAGWQH